MAISNFGELKAAVAARAIRSNLTALIPDFIRGAHDVIVGRVSLCHALTIDSETVALPYDFRQVEAVVVDQLPGAVLSLATEEQTRGLGTGTPRYFRIDGENIVFSPSPDATYTGRIRYKLKRDFFAGDLAVNTALERYPLLYLNGAMAELSAHTRNVDQEDRYRSVFASGIDVANDAELDDLFANATLQPHSQGVTI